MEKMLCVMLDFSRNAVMKPDKVKEYARIIKKMGYNSLMLYLEDTYEIESQPYFGHLRGRYTKEELKDIDSYCKSIGIEVIPCMQTLAHLGQMFKWYKEYGDINDCDDIILVGEEKTYNLIDEMFKTFAECITSRKIHIGMDEAFGVGNGKYAAKHGVRDKFEILNEHLHRVCEIADKYGFETMIWNDMFINFAAGEISEAYGTGNDIDEAAKAKILEKAPLPENVSLVYWTYSPTDYNVYDKNIKLNKLFGRKVYFGGGTWSWRTFAPYNKRGLSVTGPAVEACVDNDIDGVIMTVWGDNGGECNYLSVLPTLMLAAEKMRGNNDMDSIKKKFYEIVGVDFDSFLLFDSFDCVGGKHEDYNTVSKYLLYNDPFMGINDYYCSESDNDHYAELAEKLSKVEKGDYSIIFENLEKFAHLLSLKAALGIKTRKAYLANDKEALKDMIKEYEETLIRLRIFYESFKTQWFEYNKPHGFDVQDMRLGGLMQRITTCKERLEKYVSGEIDKIPELEEKVLESKIRYPFWGSYFTVNIY